MRGWRAECRTPRKFRPRSRSGISRGSFRRRSRNRLRMWYRCGKHGIRKCEHFERPWYSSFWGRPGGFTQLRGIYRQIAKKIQSPCGKFRGKRTNATTKKPFLPAKVRESSGCTRLRSHFTSSYNQLRQSQNFIEQICETEFFRKSFFLLLGKWEISALVALGSDANS